MSVKAETVRTLAIAAAAGIVIGAVIPAPAGSLFCTALAAGCALGVTVLGGGNLRVAGVLMLVVAGAMAMSTWPQYQQEMADYREHAQEAQDAAEAQE